MTPSLAYTIDPLEQLRNPAADMANDTSVPPLQCHRNAVEHLQAPCLGGQAGLIEMQTQWRVGKERREMRKSERGWTDDLGTLMEAAVEYEVDARGIGAIEPGPDEKMSAGEWSIADTPWIAIDGPHLSEPQIDSALDTANSNARHTDPAGLPALASQTSTRTSRRRRRLIPVHRSQKSSTTTRSQATIISMPQTINLEAVHQRHERAPSVESDVPTTTPKPRNDLAENNGIQNSNLPDPAQTAEKSVDEANVKQTLESRLTEHRDIVRFLEQDNKALNSHGRQKPAHRRSKQADSGYGQGTPDRSPGMELTNSIAPSPSRIRRDKKIQQWREDVQEETDDAAAAACITNHPRRIDQKPHIVTPDGRHAASVAGSIVSMAEKSEVANDASATLVASRRSGGSINVTNQPGSTFIYKPNIQIVQAHQPNRFSCVLDGIQKIGRNWFKGESNSPFPFVPTKSTSDSSR